MLKLWVVGAMTRSLKFSCPSDERPFTSKRGNSSASATDLSVDGKPSCVKSNPAENGVRFECVGSAR